MERTCTVCGSIVVIDECNSHKAIKYKEKFYHFFNFCFCVCAVFYVVFIKGVQKNIHSS